VGGKKIRVKMVEAALVKSGVSVSAQARNGEVVSLEHGVGPLVKCSSDFLLLKRVLPEGKKEMSGWDFWQGARLFTGIRLS